MTTGQRVGLGLTTISGVLLVILWIQWNRVLLLPLLVLTPLYVASNFLRVSGKLGSSVFPASMAAIFFPFAYFLYRYWASSLLSFWMTSALAVLLAAGISLLAFRFKEDETTAASKEKKLSLDGYPR